MNLTSGLVENDSKQILNGIFEDIIQHIIDEHCGRVPDLKLERNMFQRKYEIHCCCEKYWSIPILLKINEYALYDLFKNTRVLSRVVEERKKKIDLEKTNSRIKNTIKSLEV